MEGKMLLPGWRIEQKFNNKVLIGNWSEERLKFARKNNDIGSSTNRMDYQNYGKVVPDSKIRGDGSMRNEGLPQQFVFSHQNSFADKGNLISWYDQHMNKREIQELGLPKLRMWNGKTLSFSPEKSDYPLRGSPTKFGLYDSLKCKWARENDLGPENEYQSTYKHSYNLYEPQSLVREHFASPKSLSSHFKNHNFVNSNLHFRDRHHNIPPEYPPPVSA